MSKYKEVYAYGMQYSANGKLLTGSGTATVITNGIAEDYENIVDNIQNKKAVDKGVPVVLTFLTKLYSKEITND